MEYTEEIKKQIIEGLIETIIPLSDKNCQEKYWILGQGPNFVEVVCRFFDIFEPVLEYYKQFNFTDEQLHLLKEFYKEFSEFSDKNDLPKLFISTAEWKKIIDRAKEVLAAFNYPQEFGQKDA